MASLSPFSDSTAHLLIDGVSASFGHRRVLTDVTFAVPAGERIGLIGENGSGKSTLLRIVAGELRSQGGAVSVNAPGGHTARIGLLRQETLPPDQASVGDVLETAVEPIRAAACAVERAAAAVAAADDDNAAVTLTAALENAERLDAWGLDARIESTLSGLGLGQVELSDSAASLSGGQQARLALAAMLLSEPDVLLLDEPTNHLDDDAAAHLVEQLLRRRSPVLFASHDRAFLDEVATGLVDLDPAPLPHADAGALVQDGDGSGIGVTRYTGAYSDYVQARADARIRWERQYSEEQAQLRRLRASVKDQQTVGHEDWRPRSEGRMAQKFYADRNAKVVARRVGDARSRLTELEQRQIRKPPRELSFAGIPTLSSASSSSSADLSAADLEVHGRLARVSFSVSAGEHLLVTGDNGSGKSTLLRALAGELEPTAGVVTRRAGASISLLRQDAVIAGAQQRESGTSIARAYADAVGAERADLLPLDDFGLFAARDLARPLEHVSRGQLQRLALAVALGRMPDILLLDEPTNHLSLLLVTQFEEALPHFAGTVVVASHDRWLRQRWHGRTLHLQHEHADGAD